MHPADMRILLLPVRQWVSPAFRWCGSSNVAPSFGAAVRHPADDATPTASSQRTSTHLPGPDGRTIAHLAPDHCSPGNPGEITNPTGSGKPNRSRGSRMVPAEVLNPHVR